MSMTNFMNYSVTWNDFKDLSQQPAGEKENAQINPEMRPSNFKVGKKGKAAIVASMDMNVVIVKENSWVVTSAKSAYLLQHEQGHYDIMALAARENYNKLLKLQGSTVSDLQKQMTETQGGVETKVSIVDKRYDTQTQHGADQTKQKEWDQKIAAEKSKPEGSIDNLPI